MLQTFTVTGMTCGHCEKAVQQAILDIDPKAKITINRGLNHVEAQTDASREALAKAIADEGYAVAA
jgi:copper chaperone